MDEHVVFKDADHRIEETVCEWLEPRLKRLLYLFAQHENECEPNAGEVSEKLLDSMTTCMPFENSTGVDCLAPMISELTQLLALFHLKLVPQTFNFDRHVPNCAHAEQEWRLRRRHARFDLVRIPFGDWNADPEADAGLRAASASPFSDCSGDSNTGNDADDILDEASRFIKAPPAFLSMVLDTLHPIIFADENKDVDQDDVAAWDVLASLQCFCQDSVLKFGLNKPLTQEDTRLDRALTIIHILQNIKPPSSFSERIALSRIPIKDQLLRQAIRVSFFSNPFIPFARSENIFSSIQDVVTAGSGAGESDHDRECREALGALMRSMPNREIIGKQIRTVASNITKARKLKSHSLSAASEVSKRAASAGFSASRSSASLGAGTVETFDFPENPVAKVARLEDVVEDMSLNLLQPEERISAWQKQIPESLGLSDGTDKMTALETYSNASVESVALPAMRTAMEGVEGPANELKSEANEVVNSTVTEAVENVLPSRTDIQPTIEQTVSTSLSIKPNDTKLEIDTAAPVIALEVDKSISPVVVEDDKIERKEGIEARAKVSRQEGEDRSSKSASTEPPANITDILDQNRSVVKMVGLVRNRMNSSADPEAEIKKLDQMMRTKGGFTVAKLERIYAILKQRGGVKFAGINPVPELSAESLRAMRLLTDAEKGLASESKSASSKESAGQAGSTAGVAKSPSKVAETRSDASRVELPSSLGVTTTAVPEVASTGRIISRAHPDPVETPTAPTSSTATSNVLPITPTVSHLETNGESANLIHNVQRLGGNVHSSSILKPAPILSSADQIVDLTFSPTDSVGSLNGTPCDSRSGSSSIPAAEARLNHAAFTPYLRNSPADTLSKTTMNPEQKRKSLNSPTLMEQRDLPVGGANNETNPLLTSAQHAAKFSAQNGKQDATKTVSPLMQQPFLPPQLRQQRAVSQVTPVTFMPSFASPHPSYSLPHRQKPVSVSDHAGFIPPPVQQEHSVSPHTRFIPTPHQQRSLSHPMVHTAHSAPVRQPSATLSPTEAQLTHQLRALLNAYATYPGVISSQQLEPLQTYYLVLTQRIAKGRVLNETENATLRDISTLLQTQRAREAEQQLQTLQQQQYQLIQQQQQVKQQQRLFEQQSQAQMLQMQQQQLQQQAHQKRLLLQQNQIHSQQQLQRQSQLYPQNTLPHHQLIPPSHPPTNDVRLPTAFSNSSRAPVSAFTAGQSGNTVPLARGGSAAIPSGSFLPKVQSIGPPVGILSVSPSLPPASALSAPPSTSAVCGPPAQTQASTPIPNKDIQTVYPPDIPAAYYTEHWNRGEHLVQPVSTCANSMSPEGSESAKSQRHILESHMTHTRRQRETIDALAFRSVANRVGEQLNVWDKFVKSGSLPGSNGNIVVPPGFVGFEEGDDDEVKKGFAQGV